VITTSTFKPTTHLVGSAAGSQHTSSALREPTVAESPDALVVMPGRRGGFLASIRGHLLELAEPSLDERLAPTPDDLFIASMASDLAWSARRFLHAHGLPEVVSVSAEWRRLGNPPSVAEVSLTVTVPDAADALSGSLEDALAERVVARSLGEPPQLHLRCA
jgi:putative redox protein